MNNPISKNWYADPESRVYGDTVYMYVTKSLPFEEQLNLDLVTTKDLENFEIYKDILDMSTFSSATFAVWAVRLLHRLGAVIWTESGQFSFEQQVELARLFSSEIEYSDENLYVLLDLFA